MPGMSEIDLPSQTTWELPPTHTDPQTSQTIAPVPTPAAETEPSREESDSITFRRSHLYALLLPLAFIIGLSVGYLFWGRANTGTSTAANASAASTASTGQAAVPQTPSQGQSQDQMQQIVRYDVPIDGDPFYGPENAAITIIEFSDYECPYCRKWHVEVFQRLLEAYPGQIKFVYRDFPLTSIHPNAFSAAEAANCAGEQGLYWPYHELLFSMQLGLSHEAYTQYAKQLGANMDTFNACLTDGKYKDEIQADFEYGAQLGIRSTPTFFINGIALVGAQPYETFKQVIDKELAGEIP